MGKKKKNKTPDMFKLSKKLDPYIRDYYKNEIGVPDLSQNWLELFHGTIIDDLFTIMHANSDNQLKSDYVLDLLKPLGFTDKGGGLGTNIAVLTHPYYPGVVFKIALDENGIADNFNDCLLQDMIPNYARVYARHPSGLVTAQERYFVMKPEWMPLYRNKILKCLDMLSKDFLIADLTPSMVLNYGIDRQGDFVFIDGSDLYPLKQIKAKDRLRCVAVTGSDKNGELKRCRGKCKYNEDFSQMVCEKCGRTYIPIELRPRKEEVDMRNLFSDGFDFDDREAIRLRQEEAIKNKTPYEPYYRKKELDEEDDEMEEIQIPEGFHIQIWKDGKNRIKIAVQDGFHVVAFDKRTNTPIVKPDKKPHQQKKDDRPKKTRDIVHNDETVRVNRAEVHTYTNPNPKPPKINTKVSESFKNNLINYKTHFPDGFRRYVTDLLGIVGWDVVDELRDASADAYAIMKSALHDKDEQLEKTTTDYQAALDEITNLNSKIKYLEDKLTETEDVLNKTKAESAYYYEQSMKLEERVANPEKAISNMQDSMRAEIDAKDRTIKELNDRINVLDREKAELSTANERMGQAILDLRNRSNNTVIQNETNNSIIQKMQMDDHPSCIHIQVVEETDEDSDDLPGIIFNVRGDVVEAYENYGLPIYVRRFETGVTSLAYTSQQLMESIYDAYDETLEEDPSPVPTISEDKESSTDDGYDDRYETAEYD